jgi:hypothetical protein
MIVHHAFPTKELKGALASLLPEFNEDLRVLQNSPKAIGEGFSVSWGKLQSCSVHDLP